MNPYLNTVCILVAATFIAGLFIISAYVFFTWIYTPHVVKAQIVPLTDLLAALNTVINTELTLYERNVFDVKGALTNSNFENFYRDITTHILNSLSEDFFFKMESYIKRKEVAAIVSRYVMDYLTNKVNTVMV